MAEKSDCETPSEGSPGEEEEEEENPSWQFDGSGFSNGFEEDVWRSRQDVAASSATPGVGGNAAMDDWGAGAMGMAMSAPLIPEPVDIAALSLGKSGGAAAVKPKSGVGTKQRGVFDKRKRQSKEEEKKKPPKPKE